MEVKYKKTPVENDIPKTNINEYIEKDIQLALGSNGTHLKRINTIMAAQETDIIC